MPKVSPGLKKYERCAKFDFKRCWFRLLSPAEREEFASDAGTTSHYIQVHLTGQKNPRKPLLERLFKACKSCKWISAKSDLVLWFHER
ncbi:hypothetical protein EAO18_26460 [Klebsiella pneumoniae]|nr:hypothetical protein EAO18_26460 [Klebsiella pneumoniae]